LIEAGGGGKWRRALMAARLSAVAASVLGLSNAASAPFAVSDATYPSAGGGSAVHTKVLTNLETGECAEILASWGGKLERVALRRGSGHPVRPVIASRCPTSGQCTAEMLQGDASPGAMLIPFANRVDKGVYTFGGDTHHLSPDNSTVSHGFLIQGRPLRTVRQDATATAATVVLGVMLNGTDPGYPFVVDVTITYRLDAAGLWVTVNGRNAMQGLPAPFMVGCHPYFKLQHSTFDNATLKLDRTCTEWNRAWQTLDQVPNGTTSPFHGFTGSDTIAAPHTTCPACTDPPHWDDGFAALASGAECSNVTLRLRDGGDTLLLRMDRSFRFTQVYSGRAPSELAVEPMSSATNAFNNEDGLIVLEAGAEWEGTFGIGLE